MLDLIQVIKDSNNRIAVEDLELLGRCCNACRAMHILEIGSADGGSSVVLGLQAKDRQGHLWCIEPRPKQRMINNMNNHGLNEDNFTLLDRESPWIEPYSLPVEFDLMFIDGRHDTRWALVDYHYFEPRVRHGGIIVFHDTSGNCQEDRKQPDYGKPGYIPLVQRAIDIILATDQLEEIDRSNAKMGGAIAFRKQ